MIPVSGTKEGGADYRDLPGRLRVAPRVVPSPPESWMCGERGPIPGWEIAVGRPVSKERRSGAGNVQSTHRISAMH